MFTYLPLTVPTTPPVGNLYEEGLVCLPHTFLPLSFNLPGLRMLTAQG